MLNVLCGLWSHFFVNKIKQYGDCHIGYRHKIHDTIIDTLSSGGIAIAFKYRPAHGTLRLRNLRNAKKYYR